jgi:hypothetical protein
MAIPTRPAFLTALALAGIIAAGASVAAAGKIGGSPNDPDLGPMRCDIRQSRAGNQIVIEPIVQSDRSLVGAYSLSLTGGGSGGSSSIRQGGDFAAEAGRTTTLGRMSVGASGAAYSVTLKLTAGGASVSCTRNVTGAI